MEFLRSGGAFLILEILTFLVVFVWGLLLLTRSGNRRKFLLYLNFSWIPFVLSMINSFIIHTAIMNNLGKASVVPYIVSIEKTLRMTKLNIILGLIFTVILFIMALIGLFKTREFTE